MIPMYGIDDRIRNPSLDDACEASDEQVDMFGYISEGNHSIRKHEQDVEEWMGKQ